MNELTMGEFERVVLNINELRDMLKSIDSIMEMDPIVQKQTMSFTLVKILESPQAKALGPSWICMLIHTAIKEMRIDVDQLLETKSLDDYADTIIQLIDDSGFVISNDTVNDIYTAIDMYLVMIGRY